VFKRGNDFIIRRDEEILDVYYLAQASLALYVPENQLLYALAD
jgi:hypothetical protein